jgi:ATP-binding cassette subfamily B protein
LVSRSVAAGERIFEVLDEEPEISDRVDAKPIGDVQGRVRFEGVNFSYDSVTPTLTSINLEAYPNQVVALLGSTGSGKTTLVSLIPRFYDVTSGRLLIDDIDIRSVEIDSLRRNIGTVQQDVFLFSATIRENIAYGKYGATNEEIERVTRIARLHDFLMTLPNGYETEVGERGITLSGGQKQRLAIARTLLLDPRILVLDDSLSNVDTETEYLIQQGLTDLMKDRTTFIIAHRLANLKRADKIVVLQEGMIVQEGTHDLLLQEDGLYRQIYELQLRQQEEALESSKNVLQI